MSPRRAGEGGVPGAEEVELLAREVLDTLSRGDAERFSELVSDDVEIHTSRGIRRGRVEAEAWAANKYDHLLRRYAVDELRVRPPAGVLVHGRTEYVWKQGGEVADASPVVIELVFRAGRLTRWRFREELA